MHNKKFMVKGPSRGEVKVAKPWNKGLSKIKK
jgi:hypothetical protein